MKGPEDILQELKTRFPELPGEKIHEAYERMLRCAKNGGTILCCGNGGSAADAEHIVGELMKGFLLRRPLEAAECQGFASFGEEGRRLAGRLQRGIPAISLVSQTALATAIGNDLGYDLIYAQQVYAYGRPGDLLIALTTSGNSANVVNAACAAKARGMEVIGVTGEKASGLSAAADVCLRLPSQETYRIQEYTLPVYHALCAMLEEALFGPESA